MPNRNIEHEDARYPVTFYQVQALQVFPETAQQIARWCGGEVVTDFSPIDKAMRFSAVILPTLSGVERALESDYVVKWPSSGYSKMTKLEFDKYFEPAKES